MYTTLRKNITLNKTEFNIINNYAKKNGLSFSEFLRKAALNYIEKSENIDLLEFMIQNCKSLPEKEQEKLNNIDIDYEDNKSKEIKIDDILQN